MTLSYALKTSHHVILPLQQQICHLVHHAGHEVGRVWAFGKGVEEWSLPLQRWHSSNEICDKANYRRERERERVRECM